MPSPRIAIFGDPLDLHVIAVEEALEARGLTAKLLPPSLLSGAETPFATLSPKGLRYLDDKPPTAAWLYRLPPPAILPGPRFETLAAANAAVALVHHWEARGTKLVNPLPRTLVQNKLAQLDSLRREKVPVPDTCVCFSHAQVRAAKKALEPAIVKPLAQGWHTQLLDDRTAANTPLPCLVQRRHDGDDIRVTVVGDAIASVVKIPNAGEVDFRANPAYGAGDIAYEETALSKKELAAVQKTMRATGLVFAGIDLKRGKSSFAILEANPGPAFLDVEQKTAHAISKSLADYLIAK